MTQNLTDIGRLAYTISETCALTGLGRDAVYTAIRDGYLVARKLGRRTFITDDDLRQFLAGLPRAGGFDQVMSEDPPAPRKIKPPPAPAKPERRICIP